MCRGMRAWGFPPVKDEGRYTVFEVMPSSSMRSEMLFKLDSRRISLVSGGILVWLLLKARDATPRIMVEIPRAVRGVECKMIWDTEESMEPAKVSPKPSMVYEFLVSVTCTSQLNASRPQYLNHERDLVSA